MRERENFSPEETNKEQRKVLMEARTKLHDADDILKAADLPNREAIRGLIVAAARLTENHPSEQVRQQRVQEALSKALPELGLELKDQPAR